MAESEDGGQAAERSLTVVIPTRRGYPAAQMAIEAFAREVEAVDGEVLVMAAAGLERPDLLPPRVRWIPTQHRTVFQLREAAYRIASGSIVAVTEDHCRPTLDFSQAILDCHRLEPAALAISGSVLNGSREAAIDWAAFLITQAPNMSPVTPGRRVSMAGPIVTYKRRALARMLGRGELGTIELLDSGALLQGDEYFLASDRIAVIHEQALGLTGTSAIEFHNGRTVAAFQRLRFDGGDVVRLLLAPAIFAYRVMRTVRLARAKGIDRRTLDGALPAIVWLHMCNSSGEVVGYLLGPGGSPGRLN